MATSKSNRVSISDSPALPSLITASATLAVYLLQDPQWKRDAERQLNGIEGSQNDGYDLIRLAVRDSFKLLVNEFAGIAKLKD